MVIYPGFIPFSISSLLCQKLSIISHFLASDWIMFVVVCSRSGGLRIIWWSIWATQDGLRAMWFQGARKWPNRACRTAVIPHKLSSPKFLKWIRTIGRGWRMCRTTKPGRFRNELIFMPEISLTWAAFLREGHQMLGNNRWDNFPRRRKVS